MSLQFFETCDKSKIQPNFSHYKKELESLLKIGNTFSLEKFYQAMFYSAKVLNHKLLEDLDCKILCEELRKRYNPGKETFYFNEKDLEKNDCNLKEFPKNKDTKTFDPKKNFFPNIETILKEINIRVKREGFLGYYECLD